MHIRRPLLYNAGRTTAVAVQSGDTDTFVAAVYDGFVLGRTQTHLPFGGNDVTNALHARMSMVEPGLLAERSTGNMATARDIKERCCYVAGDFLGEVMRVRAGGEVNPTRPSGSSGSYTLPDGKEIELGIERFEVTEDVFLDRKSVV